MNTSEIVTSRAGVGVCAAERDGLIFKFELLIATEIEFLLAPNLRQGVDPLYATFWNVKALTTNLKCPPSLS